MAQDTQVKGTISELTAVRALLANGWEVSIPSVDESYDIVAKDPTNGKWSTFQVKTIRRRKDRNNEMVVYATRNGGQPYSPSDCDFIVGVESEDVYVFENTGLKEYWRTDASAAKRWVKLSAEIESEPDPESEPESIKSEAII